MSEQQVREFRMPDVGEGLAEAEIITWHVKPGDPVTDGQVVCEVETAKAAVELPIPYDGVVHELHHPEGASVDVGSVIISVTTARPAAREPVLVGYGISEGPPRRRARAAPPPSGRALAKPPVRKLAKDLGIDLAGVQPSGPDGIISREDVHAAANGSSPGPADPSDPAAAPTTDPPVTPTPEAPRPSGPPAATPVVAAPESGAPAAAAAPATLPVAAASGARETRIPVKGVRRATAQAMVASAFSAPHVTEFVTVDVTRTMRLLERVRADKEMAGLRVTPLLLVARALLIAIGRHPEINASFDEVNQEIVLKHEVNLGIAAATPRGLMVPNIKDARAKSLRRLAVELGELVAAAKAGTTPPAALANGTVTLTNIGTFGVDTGTPILNPGEAAILAVGAIGLRPWIHKSRVKPRSVVTLALSFDHRLVDGELGSEVLADVAALLEHPGRFLTWG